MATLIPAIKGKLGTTTFYEATMRVSDLLSSVTPPSDLGPVDSHIAATTPATRWIPAAKLSSVLSQRVAIAGTP